MKYAGIIIKNSRDRYLLQLRDDKAEITNPNLWGTFGGGIRSDESPVYGAIRELREELGLQLIPEDVKLFLKFPVPKHRIYLYKLDLKQDVQRTCLKEGNDMRFFSRKEILRMKSLVKPLRFIFWIYPFVSGCQSIKEKMHRTIKKPYVMK
jgi:8-oxo-dGTP pyrophosphatase MutT (NUDIX family)